MANFAMECLNTWSRMSDSGDDFQKIADYIQDYFVSLADGEYEPSHGSKPKFMTRLSDWVQNVGTERERQTLLRLIPRIFFAGTKEFESLYRAAFEENIVQWIVEVKNLKVDRRDVEKQINQALNRTWICPITDSLRINAFYKANGIKGFEFRPDWNSLAKFAKPEKVLEFISSSRIEQIVLVEDFIGTGNQVRAALDFARTALGDVQVLLLPLIICKEGLKACKTFVRDFPKFRLSPVIELPERFFVRRASSGDTLLDTTMQIAIDYNDRIRLRNSGPLGYGSIGGLVVLHSNCPNNSLPMLYRQRSNWKPLFPRIART